MERRSIDYYKKAASKSHNAELKRFFGSLAEFEKTHVELLEQYPEMSHYARMSTIADLKSFSVSLV